MENGHLLPSIDIVQRLMKVFAISADHLLNDNESSALESETLKRRKKEYYKRKLIET